MVDKGWNVAMIMINHHQFRFTREKTGNVLLSDREIASVSAKKINKKLPPVRTALLKP